MVITTDVLIIGSGVAGLMAALRFAKGGKRVAICSKAEMKECNTWYAQGGVSAVPLENGIPVAGDSFKNHIDDTLKAGAGLCQKEVVEQFVEKAFTHTIETMIDYGVEFTKAKSGGYTYSLHQEGGHSAPRIFHCADHTGQAIMEALSQRARESPLITVYENHMAIDLITQAKLQKTHAFLGSAGESMVQLRPQTKSLVKTAGDTCYGAYVLNVTANKVVAFAAQVTVLATGGAGRVYLYTSNPDTATGDGLAMYARLGYPICNMEFMQFHPTCFYNPNPRYPDQRRFLITEALRGKNVGGILTLSKNSKEDFVKALGYHPQGSASTRDVVARAIDTEMKKRGMPHVWLNVTPEVTGLTAEQLRNGYPFIYAHCLECGVDLTKEAIPVVPAAHYTCGGIPVDMHGLTKVGRLYAVGECSYTGLHGANRLASNSLSEAALYGVEAADHAMAHSMPEGDRWWEGISEWQAGLAKQSRDAIQVAFHWNEVRLLMWNLVGIARTAERLLMAKTRIEMIMEEVNRYYWNFFVTKDLLELRNIAIVSEVIIRSALLRPESRGGHCRLDWVPTEDANGAVPDQAAR
eukprot:EG_transcript_5672